LVCKTWHGGSCVALYMYLGSERTALDWNTHKLNGAMTSFTLVFVPGTRGSVGREPGRDCVDSSGNRLDQAC